MTHTLSAVISQALARSQNHIHVPSETAWLKYCTTSDNLLGACSASVYSQFLGSALSIFERGWSLLCFSVLLYRDAREGSGWLFTSKNVETALDVLEKILSNECVLV